MNIEDFKPMIKMAVEGATKAQSLIAYCDYIAHLIKTNLKYEDMKDQSMLSSVGKVNWDMTPEGAFASTKKTIMVEDRNGKQYRITVEEA